jgi:hypothetical protein
LEVKADTVYGTVWSLTPTISSTACRQKRLKLSYFCADRFHGKKTGGNSCSALNLNRFFTISRGLTTAKRRKLMEAEDFYRVISEFDFICDDIDEIKGRINLTAAETNKISQAVSSIEKARRILTELFPTIKSLDEDVREDLQAEFADLC